MAKYLSIRDGENVVYEEDSNVWQRGSNVEEVVRKLTEKAALSVDYTRSMGLSMNASKNQLLLSANASNMANVTMEVDGNTIAPSTTIELLGVGYDRKLLTAQHVQSLPAAVRQRASVVARLANYLPRGNAKGEVPTPVVLRACHGQVPPRAGGHGQAEADQRGQHVHHLEQDPGGLQ
jgi:hypothetical protein